ncbi:hypothetical protein X975_23643, partial [Stegodyphus mimosarum]
MYLSGSAILRNDILRPVSLVLRNPSCYAKVLSFSTSSDPAVKDPLPRFRTAENNPILHTKNHVGKYYTLPPNIKKNLFFSGGIPKSLETL